MRRPTLLLLVAATGCGGEEPEYAVIRDFLERSRPVRCERLAPELALAPTELRTATDSTVLVLDEAQRLVVELDATLRPVYTLRYPADGPGAAESAVSAVLLGDTAVAIASRSRFELVILGRAGEAVRTQTLGFIPNALAATVDGQVLVTAMPMGPRPPTLLSRYDGAGLHAVPVPVRPYADMMVRAFGNVALVEALPGGGALVVHQFLSPRGWRVDAGDAVTAVRVPTPDATEEAIRYVPTAPITEDQFRSMLMPGMALSVDGRRSRVYLMTLSGLESGGRPGRAVLRLDAGLGFLEAFTLDVPARLMAYVPRREAVIVVDDADAFHFCPLTRDPHGAGAA